MQDGGLQNVQQPGIVEKQPQHVDEGPVMQVAQPGKQAITQVLPTMALKYNSSNLMFGIIFVLKNWLLGWTAKDGSPSPTLGTIIKKSYDGSSVLSTSLGSKTLNNTSSLGLGGNQNLRPSCRRPPARTFHTPVGTLRLDAPALV